MGAEVSMPLRLQVHLPSPANDLRIETQLTLDGARLPAILRSLGAAQKEPRCRAVGLERRVANQWDGRDSGGSPGELSLPWRRGPRGRADLRERRDKRRPAEPSFSIRADEQSGVDFGPQGGPLEGKLDGAGDEDSTTPSKDKKLRIETLLTLDGTKLPGDHRQFQRDWEAGRPHRPLDWKGAWRISGTAEIPVDDPGNFRCNGGAPPSMATSFTRAERPTSPCRDPPFQCASDKQAVTLSDFKAGLWDRSLKTRRR